jgi:RNA polymerase sigma-70 factor (ECF subfamily)
MATKSRSLDALRSEAARLNRENRTIDVRDPRPEPLDAGLLRRERAERISAGLDQLSDKQREAIVLAFYSGHSYHDVALILGQPEGTIKSRIRNGLRALRTVLAELPDTEPPADFISRSRAADVPASATRVDRPD